MRLQLQADFKRVEEDFVNGIDDYKDREKK
jgi:diacylglycerol kinase (ATP)